jgi:hypothetical protein
MIGEYALLGDETYRTCHGLPCEYFAMSYVTCLTLKRDDFEIILSCYDVGEHYCSCSNTVRVVILFV